MIKGKLKSADLWFKIVLLFVFSGFFILSLPYPQESRQFPQLLAVVSLILTAAALAIDLFRKQGAGGEIGGVDDTELMVLDATTRKARRRRYYLAWAILLVSAGIGFLGGFLFSTILLFVSFGLLFGDGEHRVKNVIVAVVLTVGVYFVFGRIMAVPLLDGLLW